MFGKRHGIDELVKSLGVNREEMVQYLRPSEIPATWHIPLQSESYSQPDEKEPIILGYAEPQVKEKLLTDLDAYRKDKALQDRVQTVTALLKSAESAKIGIGESIRQRKKHAQK